MRSCDVLPSVERVGTPVQGEVDRLFCFDAHGGHGTLPEYEEGGFVSVPAPGLPALLPNRSASLLHIQCSERLPWLEQLQLFLSATSSEKRHFAFEYIFLTSREKLLICRVLVKNSSKLEPCFSKVTRCKFSSFCKKEGAYKRNVRPWKRGSAFGLGRVLLQLRFTVVHRVSRRWRALCCPGE